MLTPYLHGLRLVSLWQACTLANMLLATKPEYNNKFSVLVQMAPVWFSQFIEVPVAQLISLLNLDRVRMGGGLRGGADGCLVRAHGMH